MDVKVTTCPHCGKPITVNVSESQGTNWLECLPLDPEIERIVLGRNYIVGTGYQYVDGNGKKYDLAGFKVRFGLDPEAIWKEVQERRGGPVEPVVIKSNPSRPRPGAQVYKIGRF